MYMREQEFCRCYSCDGILYRVRRGDTLYSISCRFEVALEDVMDANPFINVYRLEPGMQICVPVPETEGATWEENRKSRENGRKIGDENGFDGGRKLKDESFFDGGRKLKDESFFDGGRKPEDERVFDDRRKFERGSPEDCPYGLCRDPMRFDGMGW